MQWPYTMKLQFGTSQLKDPSSIPSTLAVSDIAEFGGLER